MADKFRGMREDDRGKRITSNMVITRSPSSRGEIPEENVAERDVDERKLNQRLTEPEDSGEPDQPS